MTKRKQYTVYYSDAFQRPKPDLKNGNIDLATDQMEINFGPQHPSTHGVLRLEVVSEGEIVKEVIPHLGYMHRCFEKHCEYLNYQQIIPFVDRIDYLAAMNCEHAFVMGVEEMLELSDKIPKRIEYIRVLVCELNRIASHLLAIGTYGIDLGAVTPFLWCFRDREVILNLLEWICGARMLYNYIWVGGLFYELPINFEKRCLEFINYFKPKLDELNTVITINSIFMSRTVGIGVLPLTTALSYGVTGPMLRASGLRYDLRKVLGYSIYSELNFDVPIGQSKIGELGDCWNRLKVRIDEIVESVNIVEQCIDKLQNDYPRDPNFDPRSLCPKKIRPKKSEVFFRAENPRGEIAYYIYGDIKKDIPIRVKARGPSFCNLSVLPELCQDVLIADMVAIMGSIDIVLCEVDR